MSASVEFLWNAILTLVVAPAAWFLLYLNGKQEKLISTVSDTREEMAKTRHEDGSSQ